MAGFLYILYELGGLLLLFSGGVLAAWLILGRRLTPPRIVLLVLLSYLTTAAVGSVVHCSFFDANGLCVDPGQSALRNRIAVHPYICIFAATLVSSSLAAFLFRRKDRAQLTIEGQN